MTVSSNPFQVKTVAAMALFGLAGVDASFWAFRSDVLPVDVLDPVVRLLTFGSVLLLIQAERKNGVRISPVQFVSISFFLWGPMLRILKYFRRKIWRKMAFFAQTRYCSFFQKFDHDIGF
jgi:hypothetical protein